MKPNGINIELTPKQYDYLYETLMEAYSNDVAEQKDWDVQTFDNLIDNVCNGKSTYLSSDCLLYTSPSPRDRTRSRMPSSA